MTSKQGIESLIGSIVAWILWSRTKRSSPSVCMPRGKRMTQVTDKENPLTWKAAIAFWAIRTFATKAFKEIFYEKTVSTIDGVIYHPVGHTTSAMAIRHEREHIIRSAATWFWQLRYLLFPSFRLREEVIAYLHNYEAGVSVERILDVLVEFYSTGHTHAEVAEVIIKEWGQSLLSEDFRILARIVMNGK